MSNLDSHFSIASTGSLKLQLDYNVVLSAQRFGNASNVSYNNDTKDKLCGRIYEGALSDLQLIRSYTSLYVNSSISHVSQLFLRAPDVEFHCTDEHYSSSLSISKTSNCVHIFNSTKSCTAEYFLKHTIYFKNTTIVKPA